MRLAANEIERSLQQAAEESRGGPRPSASQLDERAEAFRRASEDRRKPFGLATIMGRKDGVVRQVLTTSFTEDHGPNRYRLVLMPYTPSQEDNRRRTVPRYLYRPMKRVGDEFVSDPTKSWSPKRPPRQSLEHSGIDVRPLMPYSHHLLLVREDRLRR